MTLAPRLVDRLGARSGSASRPSATVGNRAWASGDHVGSRPQILSLRLAEDPEQEPGRGRTGAARWPHGGLVGGQLGLMKRVSVPAFLNPRRR